MVRMLQFPRAKLLVLLTFTFSTYRKNPWRLSAPRKMRVRQRLRNVDDVIQTVRQSGVQCGALTRALALPKESEMLPKDKYTVFSKNDRGFRKSVHKVSIRPCHLHLSRYSLSTLQPSTGSQVDKKDSSREPRWLLVSLHLASTSPFFRHQSSAQM